MSDRHAEPRWGSSALVTIDVQRDTLDGAPFEIPGTSAALPAIAGLVRAYRGAGRPIVHVVRIYRGDGEDADLCRRGLLAGGSPLVLKGSDGAQLAGELLPDPAARFDDERLLNGELQELSPREHVMFKPRWGAFYRTGLEGHLRDLAVTTVVFAGCNFPNCPRTSIYEASERDFRIVAATDAISGLYDRGRDELAAIGVSMLSADEIASVLRTAVRC